MYLDFQLSSEQNKKLKLKENWLLKGGLKKFMGWIAEVSESAKDCGQFHVFLWKKK